jgi:hypothetical protein
MRLSLIPHTIHAIKRVRKTLKRSIHSFVKNTTRRVKTLSKRMNGKTAKKIRSLMKKRHRR